MPSRFFSLLGTMVFIAMVPMAGALLAQPAGVQPGTAAPVMTDEQDLRAELKDLLPRNRLMGKGRLTYWGFLVYDARLWAAPGFRADNPAAQPFALELAYLRDFSNVDIAARSITEMRRSADIDEGQARAWTAEMLRVLPNVKKGDRIMGVNRPGVGALFLVNGKPSGEIRDAEFTRLFFGIWLSPNTSEPKLRSALLAGAM
ncbi:chalcone isomerase family protein [Polaromonas sp.]|uniref:chalcone isomerase family protein n=1 Tax=Polaromonas sp. TaxID=1869339 RepID=UPI00352A4930